MRLIANPMIGKRRGGSGEVLVLSDLEACDIVLRDSGRVCRGLSGLSIARVMSIRYTEPVGVEACGR